jgi:hypothetical protein
MRRFQLLQGFVVSLFVEQHRGQAQAGQIPDFVLAVVGSPGQLRLGRLQVAGLEGLAGRDQCAQRRVGGAAELLGQFTGCRLDLLRITRATACSSTP